MPQRRGPPIFVCMKRHLSAEQRTAYEARRGAFRRLAKAIAAMTPEQRADLARKTIPLSIAGRAFSPYNTILLAMQKPAGTVFGGFRQWIEAGRCVRKGEHGAMIWCKGGSKSEAALGRMRTVRAGLELSSISSACNDDGDSDSATVGLGAPGVRAAGRATLA